MNSREELIKRLREAVSSDHARGCEGRQYACDCGHDLMIDGLLEMAADEIERNGVAQRPLPSVTVKELIWILEKGTNDQLVRARSKLLEALCAVTSTECGEGK